MRRRGGSQDRFPEAGPSGAGVARDRGGRAGRSVHGTSHDRASEGDRTVYWTVDVGPVFESWSCTPFTAMGKSRGMKFTFWPGSHDAPLDLGGKASGLLSLHHAGWPIPPWFVLRPCAFKASVSAEN